MARTIRVAVLAALLVAAVPAGARAATGTADGTGLAATDYDRLIERARTQRRSLEPHRLAAALRSFSA